MVEILLAHGADIHEKDFHGNDPLNVALFHGKCRSNYSVWFVVENCLLQ